MVKDKARVRARLTALFPKASALKNERLDALAAKLTATDESTDEEIDAELTAFNDGGLQTFEQIVQEDDRLSTALKAPKKDPKPDPTKSKGEEQEPADQETSLLDRLKKMEDELARRDATEALGKLHEKFRTDERLKKIPASWVKNNLPSTEEDFETNITSVVDEFTKFATDNKLDSFTGADTPPAGGGHNNPGGKQQASQEETDALANVLLGK